jgi:tRNA-uridine 2-sulfurtransferase
LTVDQSALVALSGGVDSAVAALLLRQSGIERLEGAIVSLWPGDDPRSCCGPTAIGRARQTAERLGMAFHVLDDQARFACEVVEPFVKGYLGGLTPNPCVNCNPARLASLVSFADELGLDVVATGHYARLVWRDGEPFVARPRDRGKDQSYMLSTVPPHTLARLAFPLGEATKDEVRQTARAEGLPPADQPESQEVCFAPDGYRLFLEGRGVRPRAGPIVDRGGTVLGEHGGHWLFTIGQRRGLGVSADGPVYVAERQAETNTVVVAPAADLETDAVVVEDVVDRIGFLESSGGDQGRVVQGSSGGGLHARREASGDRGIDLPGCLGSLTVQLRYRSRAVAVTALRRIPGRRALVRLAAPFAAPAPGQAAVFYEDEVVVGHGVIGAPAPTVASR